ncbi:MAG: PAS domain S-box protein [Bacteroidia bacterium]|nr:PAS domain S-box protein [Bacteroidia bacterium]
MTEFCICYSVALFLLHKNYRELKVQTKILFLLLLVLTTFIIFLIIFISVRKYQDNIIADEKRERQKKNIQAVLKFKNKNLAGTVNDYAVWNEMVDFVQNKNQDWAKNNLLYILKFYHIDAVWVFNEKNEMIYHVNKIVGYKNKTIPIPVDVLRNINQSRTFIFYIPLQPNLMQICGSTIHPIEDINRLTEPRGYLLMGKVWDNNYLMELGNLTNTKIIVKHKISDDIALSKTDFINTFSLNDWSGKKILDMVFIKENPFLNIINNVSLNFLIYLIILAIIIISIFIIAFHRLVNIPLRIITESLNKDNVEILKFKNPKDEFGQIGDLIKKFYEQKQNLAFQIEENIKKTQALAETEMNFRSFIEQSSDGIMIFDHTGAVIEMNTAITNFFRESKEKLVGNNAWDLQYKFMHTDKQTPDNYDRIKNQITESLKSKNTSYFNFNREEILFLPDGSEKHIAQSVFPIQAGEKFLVGTIISDITKLKQAETDIINALKKEKELHELKSHFISTVSHEFRTPMTIIYSNLQLIEILKDNPKEKEKCFGRIYTAIRQMTHILDEVNLINKDFAGKLGFNPAPIHFENFCRQIVEEAAGLNKQIPVKLEIRDVFENILIDSTLVQYIILNLLSNGIKFSREGYVVRFNVERSGNILLMTFEDKGIGIPADDIPRIFEPFHRAHNAENIKGTGLGMSIVKRSVDLHNGSMEIRSKVGAGTVITVRLPFETV